MHLINVQCAFEFLNFVQTRTKRIYNRNLQFNCRIKYFVTIANLHGIIFCKQCEVPCFHTQQILYNSIATCCGN